MAHGRCDFGDGCRNSHDVASNQKREAGRASVSVVKEGELGVRVMDRKQRYGKLVRMLKPYVDDPRKRFVGEGEMEEFAIALEGIYASSALDNHDRTDLLVLVTEKAGVTLRITDVLQSSGSMPTAILCVLGFLASDFLLSSSQASAVNQLFGALDQAVDELLPALVKYLEKITPNGNNGGSLVTTGVNPTVFFRIFKVTIRVFLEYITRFRKACADHPDLEANIKVVCTCFDRWSAAPPLTLASESFSNEGRAFLLGEIRAECDRLLRATGHVQQKVVPGHSRGGLDPAHPARDDLVRLRRHWAPPGGRHANDYASISDITVFPPVEELLCTAEPCKPANYPLAPHHIENDGVARQLDTMFRLTREDFLAQMRGVVQGLFSDLKSAHGHVRTALKKGRSRRIELHNGDESIFCFIYPNGRVNGMDFGKSSVADLALHIEVDFPQRFRGGSSRRLENGALVALIEQNDPFVGGRFFLGVIVGLVMKDETRASVLVKAFDIAAYAWAIPKRTKIKVTPRWLVLVEILDILVATILPFLEALQKVDPVMLPLSRYLAAPTPHSTPDMTLNAPHFARAPSFHYDLSKLVGGANLTVNINDSHSWYRAKAAIANSDTLDPSQADALLDCLRHEVALIEGPPGTGKSYIGLKIVETLLRSKVRPIVLLCVTNHALDQFLEHLLDGKVTENIVRLGSRTKSEKIKPFSLFERSAGIFRGPTSKRHRWELLKQQDNLKEQVQKLAAACFSFSSDHPLALLKSWLSEEYPMHLKAIESTPAGIKLLLKHHDADGWITVGRQGRGTDKSKHDILRRWLDGDDLYAREASLPRLEEQRASKPTAVSNKPFDGPGWAAHLAAEDELERSRLSLQEPGDTQEDDLSLLDHPDVTTLLRSDVPQTSRPLDFLRKFSDVWSMSLSERTVLFDYWQQEGNNSLVEDLNQIRGKLVKVKGLIKELDDTRKASLLAECDIIAGTTNGAAQLLPLLKSASPHVLIVEEAGEVLESQILATLVQSIQQLVLIGDHLQLRPHIATYGLSFDSNLGKMFRADQSLFERLVRSGMRMSCLTVQRRMKPEISELLRATLYPSLEDHEQTRAYPSRSVKGVEKDVVFIDHRLPEDSQSRDHSSRTNTQEAEFVRVFALYLIKQGYGGRLAIVTPYLGQVALLRKLMVNDKVTVVLDERDEVQIAAAVDGDEDAKEVIRTSASQVLRITCIDNFQGEEDDIIILSLVRNYRSENTLNAQTRTGSIGFLKSPNRANVALSRARHGMYIFGNAELLESQSDFWRTVVERLRQTSRIMNGIPIACQQHPRKSARLVQHPCDFTVFAPDGGCIEPCLTNLPCGHVCNLKCHPDDLGHKLIRCPQPCTRLHEDCGHPCQKLCSEECEPCNIIFLEVTLSCGHVAERIRCFLARNPCEITCEEAVEKGLECGHSVTTTCSTDLASLACADACGKYLDCCKRPCKARCSLCRSRPAGTHAEHICGKPLLCGHLCSANCGHEEKCPPCTARCDGGCEHGCRNHVCSSPCVPCKQACSWKCSHGQKCLVPCGTPCTRLPCDEACSRTLNCGHPCPSICGEDCLKQICVTCASPDVRSQCVDMIDPDRTLGDLKLFGSRSNVSDRLITLSCGHAFTVETLDGHLELNIYYDKAPEGHWSKPLPLDSGLTPPKRCITCRRPITAQFARRYGRVIQRARLDAAEKATIIRAEEELSKASETLGSLIVGEPPVLDFDPRQPVTAVLARQKECLKSQKALLLPTPRIFDVTHHGFSTASSKRWDQLVQPLRQVYAALYNVATRRSPHREAYEAAIAKLCRYFTETPLTQRVRNPDAFVLEQSRATIGTPPPKTDVKYAVQASWLAHGVLLRMADFAARIESLSSPSSNRLSFFTNFLLLAAVKSAEITANTCADYFLGEKAVGSWARYVSATLELVKYESKLEATHCKVELTPKRREEMAEKYSKTLDVAFGRYSKATQTYHEHHPSIGQIVKDAEDAMQKMRAEKIKIIESIRTGERRPLSFEERLMVVKAMNFSTTGHWFRCPNGHTFAIDECGGAMEVSRCNECGERVGGTGHRLLDGVDVDETIEDISVEAGARRQRYMWGGRG